MNPPFPPRRDQGMTTSHRYRRALPILAVALLATASPVLAADAPPTFHRDVERILQNNCQDCHRPGQVAPFSLLTFDQASKRGGDLASVTHDRRMPPWPASTEVGGPFRDARVLPPAQIATIAAWVEAGCPEGDPADAPPPRTFKSGWTLGEPDLILTAPETFTLQADGPDEQRIYVIPTGMTEGRWVVGVEYKPGNAKVVHHIIGGVDTKKRGRVLDQADPKPGYKAFGGFGFLPDGFMLGWSPGRNESFAPRGTGRYMPANSDFLMQVHYHPSGKPEADRTQVGIYFAKEPVDKEVSVRMIAPARGGLLGLVPSLRIPANEANHEVVGTMTLDEDRRLVGITPHMHWLGKDFQMKATLPDGTERILIRVDRWDFNWQGVYDLVESILLPRGTRVDMLAHFDNSASNPANPSKPPVDVRWGEQTTDEMCIGFLYFTRDSQHLAGQPPARFRAPADQAKITP